MKFGSLGELIKYRREEKGWSQRELAEKIGTNVVVICRYERNRDKPRLKRLEKIMVELGMPIKDLGEVYQRYSKEYKKIQKIDNLGDFLKTRRIEKGWTQRELAEKIGISRSTIKSYEINGCKPKFEILEKIMVRLEIQKEEIKVYPKYEKIYFEYKKFQRIDSLGSLLRRYRFKKGLTQEELAERIGIHVCNIASYERDKTKPRVENLTKLINFFKIPINKINEINNYDERYKKYKENKKRIDEGLGWLLRRCRLKKGLTRKNLSEKVRVSWRNIRNYEENRCKPRSENLTKLRKFFKIPINKINDINNYDEGYKENKKRMSGGLGGLLEEHRLEKRLTQKELAERVGVSDSAIRTYERNKYKPGFLVMKKLREILNISENKLKEFYEYDEECRKYERRTNGFGGLLRRRRLKEGLTMKKLGKKVLIPWTTIKDYEGNKHKPIFENLEKLIYLLDIPTKELKRVDKKYYEEYLKHKKSEEKYYSGLVEAAKEYLRR